MQEDHQELFFKNVDFFKKYYPNIYLKLNNLNKEQRFALVSNDFTLANETISLLNLQVLANKEVAYQSNPLEIAKNQANNALENDSWISFQNDNSTIKNIDKIICISNGLGYNLTQYNLRYNLKSILIIEENLEIFRLSLFVTDYYELCYDKNVTFCIEEDDETIKNTVLKFYHSLFFYNDSLKLAQFFNNGTMKYVISILQENLNESVYNRTLNYSNILEKIINNDNYEKIYDDLINDVFKKHICTKELIFIAIELLVFINKNIDLQTNNNSISNYLYCVLYYITSVYKEKGLEHIHTNSFYVIAKNANLRSLQNDIYNKMIFLFNKSKNKELESFFQLKQREQSNYK